VPITRQAVATSPSAALRLAAKAGFPVDVKPWGPDVPSERDGCPVERGLASAADVRRAFAAVLAQAGQPLDGGAVIVRASPRPGRELRVKIVHLPDLGPTVIVEVPGQPPEAAPAPLRPPTPTRWPLAWSRPAPATTNPTASASPICCAGPRTWRSITPIAWPRSRSARSWSRRKGDGAVVVDAEIALRP
jgi:hypothetical protein